MSLGDLLKRAADAVVQGALVSYYFVYYLVKGHENEDANQQQLCIDNKPVRPAYSGPAMAANANVCCLHGVQNPTPYGYPPPPPPIPRRVQPVAGPGAGVTNAKSGWRSWLNPKTWFSGSKPAEKAPPVQERPVAPPRHFKPLGAAEHVPNGSSAPDDHRRYSAQKERGQESWLSTLWSYLPSFGKKPEHAESERSSSPIATRRILKVVTIPGPGTVSFGSDERPQSDLVRGLKHAVEPHYPATLPHDQDGYRPHAPPAPPAPPQANVGQATGQIHVKPRALLPTVKPDDAWVTAPSGPSDIPKQVIWSPTGGQQPPPQPHAASTMQVQMQRQQLRKTTTTSTENRAAISPTPYEPEDSQKSVRELKRQWPPPSNATGVEIVKDLVFPSGAPGDLSSAMTDDGEASFNYDAYRPSSRAETSSRSVYEDRRREYSGGQDYSEPTREFERSAVSPERFRELSQELTSKSSAGKGVEMFVRRRQNVENYVNEESQQPRPAAPSSVQRMVPVAAPRKRVSANEVVDSVVEAATRKEYHWQPEPIAAPPPSRPDVSSPIRRELERVVSPTPAVPSWRQHERHERFFSPQPFSSGGGHAPSRDRLFTPPPRTHEPKVQQQAYRSVSVLGDRMEQKELVDWTTGPDMTTTVVSANTPSAQRTMTTSTYAASRGSQYTKTSSYNTLPRTWKSYSEAYNQARF